MGSTAWGAAPLRLRSYPWNLSGSSGGFHHIDNIRVCHWQVIGFATYRPDLFALFTRFRYLEIFLEILSRLSVQVPQSRFIQVLLLRFFIQIRQSPFTGYWS
jgi:hypothetical protein